MGGFRIGILIKRIRWGEMILNIQFLCNPFNGSRDILTSASVVPGFYKLYFIDLFTIYKRVKVTLLPRRWRWQKARKWKTWSVQPTQSRWSTRRWRRRLLCPRWWLHRPMVQCYHYTHSLCSGVSKQDLATSISTSCRAVKTSLKTGQIVKLFTSN